MTLDLRDDRETWLLATNPAGEAWAEPQTHRNTFPMSQLCVPVASSSLGAETW